MTRRGSVATSEVKKKGGLDEPWIWAEAFTETWHLIKSHTSTPDPTETFPDRVDVTYHTVCGRDVSSCHVSTTDPRWFDDKAKVCRQCRLAHRVDHFGPSEKMNPTREDKG